MRNQPSQPGTLDEYAELMDGIDMPQGVRRAAMTEAREAEANAEAVSAQAASNRAARNSSLPASERQARIVDGAVQNSASSHAERAASPVQHAKPTCRIAPRRTRSRWIGIAACLVLAMGIGALALAVGPFAAQHDTAREGTGSGLVSSDALPEGNFFTLAAYADEASRPADAGTTIDLDASGIRPVNYNNAWIDPETGEQADRREFAGMKAGMNAGVVGNSVETVTYSIEGEGAYLETISDDLLAQEEINAFREGKTDILEHANLQRSKSFTLDYDDVALENGMQVSDVPAILSIYLKVPVPDKTLSNWDVALSTEDFAAGRTASMNASAALDIAGSEVLATCKLSITATFTDGSAQTKTYAIGLVPDYEKRITDYWNAVNESGYDYELAMANDEEPSDEARAKAEAGPEEPALYTLTEIAES